VNESKSLFAVILALGAAGIVAFVQEVNHWFKKE